MSEAPSSPALNVGVVTLFPDLLRAFAATSIVGRAIESGRVSVHLEELRRHGLGRHLSVDDTPYGGGSGMVLRVDCVVAAMEAAEQAMQCSSGRPTRVLLTPSGERFSQSLAHELASLGGLLLVCGRYEGFDARVGNYVDREVSIGDFVMAGGEVAAMAIVEAAARLVPGVLGNEESSRVESFAEETGGLLEFPQYTRPREFRGASVPEVLLGGNHGEVERWRRERTLERTQQRRPDLLPEGPSGSGGPGLE